MIAELDAGPPARRREGADGGWVTHQWMKKAVLLSFRLADNAPMRFGRPRAAQPFAFYDKVPTKFAALRPTQLRASGRARRAAGGRAPRRVRRDATSC